MTKVEQEINRKLVLELKRNISNDSSTRWVIKFGKVQAAECRYFYSSFLILTFFIFCLGNLLQVLRTTFLFDFSFRALKVYAFRLEVPCITCLALCQTSHTRGYTSC